MVIFKNNYYIQGHYLFSKIIIGKKGFLNLGSSLKQIQKEIKTLEDKLFILVKQEHQDILTLLRLVIAGNC
jgi:hypothetical protein